MLSGAKIATLKAGKTLVYAFCPGTDVEETAEENDCSVSSKCVAVVTFVGADATEFTDDNIPDKELGGS
jgi:hypothetical protein